MKHHAEVCEIGDIIGRKIVSLKSRRCKHQKCKTILHQYHKSLYCHVHESVEMLKNNKFKYAFKLEKFISG